MESWQSQKGEATDKGLLLAWMPFAPKDCVSF
jgi:hypothetical protein